MAELPIWPGSNGSSVSFLEDLGVSHSSFEVVLSANGAFETCLVSSVFGCKNRLKRSLTVPRDDECRK